MKNYKKIYADKIPVWLALSKFYLDVELKNEDYSSIALAIYNSPFELKKVKEMNTFEVFPILQYHLMSIAGEWIDFDEEKLIEAIVKSIDNRIKDNILLFYI